MKLNGSSSLLLYSFLDIQNLGCISLINSLFSQKKVTLNYEATENSLLDLQSARQMYTLQRYSLALDHYRKLQITQIYESEDFKRMVHCAILQHDFSTAFETIRQLIEINVYLPDGFASLAYLYKQIGNLTL